MYIPPFMPTKDGPRPDKGLQEGPRPPYPPCGQPACIPMPMPQPIQMPQPMPVPQVPGNVDRGNAANVYPARATFTNTLPLPQRQGQPDTDWRHSTAFRVSGDKHEPRAIVDFPTNDPGFPSLTYKDIRARQAYDPSVPIAAMPDGFPSTSSGVDPHQLPRQVLNINRRVVLFVSASGSSTSGIRAFAQYVEDAMFASSTTPYDVEILPNYSTASMDAAAGHLLLYIKLMSFDTTQQTRIVLVGVDLGGLVAIEAVRMFLAARAQQAAQNNPSMVVPRDRESNWLLRISFHGVICINSPVFLVHPLLFGHVDRQGMGKYAPLFHGSVTNNGQNSAGASDTNRDKRKSVLFDFSRWTKALGGMVSPSGGERGAPTTTTAHNQGYPGSAPRDSKASLPVMFDSSWDHRLALMPSLATYSQDRMIRHLNQLLASKVQMALLYTRTLNGVPGTAPTYVHIPEDLPEHIARLFVPFNVPSHGGQSAYQLMTEVLDPVLPTDTYSSMALYVSSIVTSHWGSK